jgi:beta-glucanase (GH16 family)
MIEIIDEKFFWMGRWWWTRERWGSIHAQKKWIWYDPSCIHILKNNQLALSVRYNPKYFDTINGFSNFGTGQICSVDDFGFGKFTIEAKLPTGVGTWPAFWMYSPEDWPPEIDIFEGYSRDNYYANNRLFSRKYKILNCLHLRDEWNLKGGEPEAPPVNVFKGHPAETFNEYSLIWTDLELTFLINGNIIRRITDREILARFAGYKMMVLLNNHVDGRYLNKFTVGQPFLINFFGYENYQVGECG